MILNTCFEEIRHDKCFPVYIEVDQIYYLQHAQTRQEAQGKDIPGFYQ